MKPDEQGMTNAGRDVVLSELRAQIERLELGGHRLRNALAFDLPEIDNRLPGGGLRLGALHEVSEAAGIITAAPGEDAFRTDLAEAAREAITEDVNGTDFQKGTVEVTEGGV